MQRTSLPPYLLTSAVLSSLLQPAIAQAPANANAAAGAKAVEAAKDDPRLQGLPTFLRPVPGGLVEMGLTAEQLIASSCQTAYPIKPQDAAQKAQEKVITGMRRAALLLGTKKVQVDGFLLAEWPVTNAEYERFVARRRANGEKVRPPFAWWRYGRKDDYDARLEDINRQFPKNSEGPFLYWEANGHELPYALVDENGKSIANHAVTTLTYRDAVEFAGTFGMRLPTEAEFTRAARGDGSHRWPWGRTMADSFSEAGLQFLGLNSMAGQKPSDVGKFEGCAGPFGHKDIFGRIWQFTSGVGYGPISGREAFEVQWKLLQKDRVGALLQGAPIGKDDMVVCKGGSYLSWSEPMQLLIDNRVALQTNEPQPSVGMRLAKSTKPGFDALYSKIRGQYNRGAFVADQVLDEAAQVGAERYELNETGFPVAYHTVSFMPVNWLSNEKNTDINKQLDKTHSGPLLLGTLYTTEPLRSPALAPGLYTVLYRKAGMPRELADAIKTGHKELLAAKKAKPAKEGEEKAEPKDDGKEAKKSPWRELVARAGITAEDLLGPDGGSLKIVRIDGVEVSTETDCFLLMGGIEGRIVGVVPATNHKPANTKPFVNELLLEKQGGNDKATADKAVARFRLAIPVRAGDARTLAEFRLQLPLECEPPSASKVWRLPREAAAEAAGSGASATTPAGSDLPGAKNAAK
jgi:formylglycine-generating enzyme required for sulfatase activity